MTWGIEQIKAAYDHGAAEGATHMIVSHDFVDFDNTATYIMPGEDPRTAWTDSTAYKSGYTGVDEVYAYHLGWDSQSQERRARHWEAAPLSSEG